MLDIQGTTATINGEQVLSNPTLNQIDTSPQPTPMGATNSSLGGGGSSAGSNGQQGVYGGSGLNNIGLLMTTWGIYSKTGAQTFTVDDGSGAPVTCVVPSSVTLGAGWKFVAVTGISSCQVVGEQVQRLLRVRTSADIVVVK